MKQRGKQSGDIIAAKALLEQVKNVEKMLALHQGDDGFMANQYQYQKDELMNELDLLLKKHDLSFADVNA